MELKDKRTFLYLKQMSNRLAEYASSDPRFKSKSEAARHLLEKGMEADAGERKKALKSVSV